MACSLASLAIFGLGGGAFAVVGFFLVWYNVGHFALRIWGLDPRGYKGPKPEQRAKRAALTARLCDATASWLAFADADRASVADSDHLFDALICALLARLISDGRSRQIEPKDRAAAVTEGWIHLPLPGSLGDLATE